MKYTYFTKYHNNNNSYNKDNVGLGMIFPKPILEIIIPPQNSYLVDNRIATLLWYEIKFIFRLLM